MALRVLTVPCLEDNYAFVIGNPDIGEAAVVDVPEAAPLLAAIKDAGWTLTTVLLTHHHWDHVDGLANMDRTGLTVIGAEADAHRLPALDRAVAPGETLHILGHAFDIWDVSGHTNGHIAYLTDGYAFTGDSLMAMGCGRLFEGTPDQMHASLSQFASLPGDTIICSCHEYTANNARFALTLEPDNPDLISRIKRIEQARADNLPTVPSTLDEERATNPFLRCHLPALKHAVGQPNATDVQTFAAVRAAKDSF